MKERNNGIPKNEWRAAKARAKETVSSLRSPVFWLSFVVLWIVLLLILILYLLGSYSGLNALLVLLIAAVFLIFIVLFLSGYTVYLMKTARCQPDAGFSDLNYGFDRRAGAQISLVLQLCVRIFLWSLLFLIPGIVAVYRYRFSLFILIDHPGLPASTAIRLSSEMTQGLKGGLFVLDLSFIGQYIESFLIFFMAYFCIFAIKSGYNTGSDLAFLILAFLSIFILGTISLVDARAQRGIACICIYDSVKDGSQTGASRTADEEWNTGEDTGSRRSGRYRDDPWD